ncbi:glycosyltransferase family 4 protein [Candidatus Babeliales bacterium]|nr:glycosyltransferase family 4 protein [Candidatus Babeliales bacterium]
MPIIDPGSTSGCLNIQTIKVIHNCLRIRRIVNQGKYNQVWINTSIYPTAFAKLLILVSSLMRLKHPIIRVFFHGGRFDEIGFLHSNLVRRLASKILQRCHSLHFLSREQGEGFAKVFPNLNWEQFSNYLPVDSTIQPKSLKKKIFLFVGRLVEEKGTREIVSSLDSLISSRGNEDFAFWFVGDGPEMRYLQSVAKKYPKDLYCLLGRLNQDALEDIYRQSFALLLPSYHREGFPYVVIEAMRAGLPIIATPTGVLPDIIHERKNGFLIPPLNHAVLTKAIEKLLDNPDLYAAIQRNNISYFQQHLSKAAAEKYYRSLVSTGAD